MSKLPAKPRSLAHPPQPVEQDRDASYLAAGLVLGVGLLLSSVFYHPRPETVTFNPEPANAAAATGPTSGPTDPPPATTEPVAETTTQTAPAASAAATQTATQPAVGGGGQSVNQPSVGQSPGLIRGVLSDTRKLLKDRDKRLRQILGR